MAEVDQRMDWGYPVGKRASVKAAAFCFLREYLETIYQSWPLIKLLAYDAIGWIGLQTVDDVPRYWITSQIGDLVAY